MTTLKHLFAISALSISLPAIGCVAAPDDEALDGVSTQDILGGTTDPSAAYRAVTFTISIAPEASTYYVPSLCTGTLVASAWILTAAHCVTDEATGAPLAPSQFFISGAGAVSDVHVMPGWLGRPSSALPGAVDVALLHLTAPLDRPNNANLPCPQVDATHGCVVASVGGFFPSGGPLHCVSEGPRLPGGSFHASGDVDAADFVESDANVLAGTPWYRFAANASGQTMIQSDEGAACFGALASATAIRGALLSVNSFDAAQNTVPPSSTHLEYATLATYFRSWMFSVIPPQQIVLVVPRGGNL